MVQVSAVDSYVAELDSVLRGPTRAKRDLLQEAHDHLVDAADAYADDGLSPIEAERRAVRDFGTVRDVMGSYQAILSVGQSRRIGLWMLAAVIAQPFAWRLWAASPYGEQTDRTGALYGFLDAYVETIGLTTMVLAALAVIGCGIGTRYLGVREWVLRLTLTSITVSGGLIMLTAVVMVVTVGAPTLIGVAYSAAVVWAPMSVLVVAGIRALRGVDAAHRFST